MDTEPDIESNTESTRKLASIQVVSALVKHPNADSLWVATVLGWQVIVKEGEVSIGDKIILCEIDCLIPSQAAWLPAPVKDRIKREKATTHFRVKTIQLRQEISQGLIVSIGNLLPPLPNTNYTDLALESDLTLHLGILKYEAPIFTSRHPLYQSKTTNTFPSDIISKTDEVRVQSKPSILETLIDRPYYMSLKMDGTSVTYLIHPTTNEFVVASRNMIRDRPEGDDYDKCPYWHIAVNCKIEEALRRHPHLAIQGEICGPNIQRNLVGLSKYEFYVFNITDISIRARLPYRELKETCKLLDLQMVPIEEEGEQFLPTSITGLLLKAKGQYKNTKNHREGLVVRSQDQQITFKIINNDYLVWQK
jgi:RNA ligase (TIGR02306 family)